MPDSRPPIAIVGDDLSGVATVAAEAYGCGFPVAILPWDALPNVTDAGNGILAVDLACREENAETNFRRAVSVIEWLLCHGIEEVVVKVDSLWRGQPWALIQAAGRFGQVAVVGEGVVGPQSAGLVGGIGAIRLVAETPFQALGEIDSLRKSGVRFWSGSVGVVRAIMWAGLAERSTTVVVAGSLQTIVAEQVDSLKAVGSTVIRVDNGAPQEAIGRQLSEGSGLLNCTVIRTVEDGSYEEASTTQLSEAVAEECFYSVADSLRPLVPGSISCLFLTGGHTASVVLRGLGLSTMQLMRPGAFQSATVSRVDSGPLDGLLIATKPGHFGNRDTIVKAVVDLQLRRYRSVSGSQFN